jgi:hypothetical protein
MAQPPTSAVLARELVRPLPFAAQSVTRNASLGIAGTIVAEFDVASRVTDRNQRLTGAFPGATNPLTAIGPLLDAVVFSAAAGTLLVEYAVDLSCSYRQVSNSVVPASTLVNISGLRITGCFCRVTFTMGAGGPALVEFGAFVRST